MGVSHLLVVVRHAKSDWSVAASDRERPLAPRGRRQAPAIGDWLAAAGIVPSLAVVLPAARARQTWELVAPAVIDAGGQTRVEVTEAAYTFSGSDLLALVRGLPAAEPVVALVSHNPAVEELVEELTERWVALPTSALAVVELPCWTAAGREPGRIRYAGRPFDA